MSYKTQAIEKLNAEYAEFTGDLYQSVMKSAVKEALVEFIQKNEEFAQAVVQGGNFADCMAAVSKGVKSSLPDIEAYRRAAGFYFPGATVRMDLVIQLEPAEAEQPNNIIIDLSDFF